MMFEQAFRDLLIGDAAIIAIASSRVAWGVRPQESAIPAITLTVASRVERYVQTGRVTLQAIRVQVDCWAATALAAKTLAKEVRQLLSGYRGGDFDGIFLDSANDVPREGTAVEKIYGSTADYICHYKGDDE